MVVLEYLIDRQGILAEKKEGASSPLQTPWRSRPFGDTLWNYHLLRGLTLCVHGL